MPVTPKTRAENLVTIFDALATQTQPLTAKEISALTGIEVSETNKCLADLRARDAVYFRVENKIERSVRFGGPAKAGSSRLYSLTRPFPSRTVREAVPGVVQTAAPTSYMPTREIKQRAGAALIHYSTASRVFTVNDFARRSGVNSATMARKMSEMRKCEAISRTRSSNGRTRNIKYRINDLQRCLDIIGYQPEITRPAQYQTSVSNTPAADGPSVILTAAEVEAMLVEKASLEAKVAALEAAVTEQKAAASRPLTLAEFLASR